MGFNLDMERIASIRDVYNYFRNNFTASDESASNLTYCYFVDLGKEKVSIPTTTHTLAKKRGRPRKTDGVRA